MEIEIIGHKAKIERISGQVKLEPWYKEAQLVVWLSFDEAVGGVLSFAILLPVKKYEREELLYHIRRRGGEELKRILEKDLMKQAELKDAKERQVAVDAVAAEAQSLIE